ncbi:MAG TPA: hypothetical protein VHM02_11270 [Thermoanaerobaculia bacterium]|nr:hypothetical protein [Thermoanaerobaculia bacterium]
MKAKADVSVRDCIAPAAGWAQAYELPPNSGWTVLGTLQFNHDTTSDYVVNAMVDFAEGNTANTLVEYQLLLDGNPHGWFTKRVPERFHNTQVLRSLMSNVSGGIHTLGIQARNLSTTASVYYNRIWLSPLLVEGSEITTGSGTINSISVGTSWTTIQSTTINTPSDKMNYVAAFLTVTGGTPLGGLEYRILRGFTQLDHFIDTVPDVMWDGVHVAHIDTAAPSGSSTYHLQARITSGSTATIGARSLEVQSLPELMVFDVATTSSINIPSDNTWHTVSTSGTQQLHPMSIGQYGTDGHGFAHVTHTGPYDFSGELRFQLYLLDETDPNLDDFEVGWLEVHPVGQRRLMTNLAEWEQLGLNSSDDYEMRLEAKGICAQMGATQTLAQTRFQVIVLPDDTPYTYHPCSDSPGTCCANNFPACQVYSCTMSSSLQIVSVPAWNCQ